MDLKILLLIGVLLLAPIYLLLSGWGVGLLTVGAFYGLFMRSSFSRIAVFYSGLVLSLAFGLIYPFGLACSLGFSPSSVLANPHAIDSTWLPSWGDTLIICPVEGVYVSLFGILGIIFGIYLNHLSMSRVGSRPKL